MTATDAGAGGELAQVSPGPPAPPPAPPSARPPRVTTAESADNSGQTTDRRRKSPVRLLGFALLAGVAGLTGWLLMQRGIISNEFPPVLPDQQSTPITRYSGPWLTAAAGAALVAGLLLLAAVVEVTRWFRRSRPDDGGRA